MVGERFFHVVRIDIVKYVRSISKQKRKHVKYNLPTIAGVRCLLYKKSQQFLYKKVSTDKLYNNKFTILDIHLRPHSRPIQPF